MRQYCIGICLGTEFEKLIQSRKAIRVRFNIFCGGSAVVVNDRVPAVQQLEGVPAPHRKLDAITEQHD